MSLESLELFGDGTGEAEAVGRWDWRDWSCWEMGLESLELLGDGTGKAAWTRDWAVTLEGVA